MDDRIGLLISLLGPDRIKKQENLKHHTYTQLDVVCDNFYIVTTQKELVDILKNCLDLKIPVTLFGNGTKLVVRNPKIAGLTIKNRTGFTKISGIKGKVGPSGIGIEEALVESDSGVSIEKLNEFLKKQGLKPIDSYSSLHSSLGGALFIDPSIRKLTQKVKIWKRNKQEELTVDKLDKKMVVLSAVLKVKAV